MNAKKLIALLLAVVMVLGLVACGGNADETTTKAPAAETTTPAADNNEGGETAGKYTVDYATNSVNVGSVEAVQASSAEGEVGYDVYAGTEGKDYTDPEVYTYRDYTAGTTNMKWSTHTWETDDDSAVLDRITSGFYGFVLDSTADGWSIVCEMAAELPVDVTADYVGQYGIEEGETAKAWKIALNPDACWEDGTPINADTYMYSYKELLDPMMKNRRADSLYAGDFEIYGTKAYFKQGQTVPTLNTYDLADLTVGDDGVYVDPDGNALYFHLTDTTAPNNGGYSLSDLAEMGYMTEDVFNGLSALADADGYVPFTEESKALLFQFTNSDNWGNEPEETLSSYAYYKYTYPEMSFDGVGIVKTGDYELVIVTTTPTANANYYVPYNLSSTYLVYEPMWEACKTYYNAKGDKTTAEAGDATSVTTNYCTTQDTTMSYGPYKMTYFELDKQITFERNENWYGYSDGKHLGQYQTDIISVQVIGEQATALLAFLNGELDNVSLTQADMSTYAASDYVRYTPQSHTTKLTFNTDADSLASRGTQVLLNPHFRQAFSLAIDRTTFSASYTAAGSAGYGLLNNLYVYDPFTGATYRSTDGAMDAIVSLYGLTYGEDGDFDTLEEAYEAITGYDLPKAQELMAQAYDECVEAGYYDGSSNIELEMRVYQSDDIYVQMFNYLNDCLKSACVGTGFEGKVSLKMTVDADYYETMYSGGTDIIFTTWGGATYSPYTTLYQCYCDASDGSGNQMEYGFDTSKVNVTMEINGESYTDSLQDWALWANGSLESGVTSDNGTVLEPFASFDADSQATMFSRLEYAYLSFYTTTPMYYRNVASMVSQKGDYAVDTYIDLIGFGGIQFYTYDYTDAEWDAVAGTLTY